MHIYYIYIHIVYNYYIFIIYILLLWIISFDYLRLYNISNMKTLIKSINVFSILKVRLLIILIFSFNVAHI